MSPWNSWSMSPWFLLFFSWLAPEILWDLILSYVILLTFRNLPRVIIFPNPLPVLNRDVVPNKWCASVHSLHESSSFPIHFLYLIHFYLAIVFFRCEQLTDLVKHSDVLVCIPTSRKLWHASLGFGLAATQTFWLLGRLNLLLETPSKLIDS